eukprot:15433745-Alexandrium_andersonii.AAC.1
MTPSIVVPVVVRQMDEPAQLATDFPRAFIASTTSGASAIMSGLPRLSGILRDDLVYSPQSTPTILSPSVFTPMAAPPSAEAASPPPPLAGGLGEQASLCQAERRALPASVRRG